MLDDQHLDRAAGVLVGQAAGDALGVPYEFRAPLAPDEPARMVGGGLGPYQPGEYSDDTQMAVCIAVVSATGADLTTVTALDAVAVNFTEWLRNGATDIGNQTRHVLSRTSAGAVTAAAMRQEAQRLHHRTGMTAGNGALMRTGIVGLAALDDPARTAEAARAVAELTHADPLAGDSCVLWSETVRAAVLGAGLDLAAGLRLLPPERRGSWAAWITDAAEGPPQRFLDNGFTVTALQAAWWAITSTAPSSGVREAVGEAHVEAGLQAAVHVGGDTDTVAAIAGTLLGARWGASCVPAPWREALNGLGGRRAADLTDLAVGTVLRGG